jgi:hypothetical protein
VYVARLAGIAVFDPNGEQVGRVRDAVARTRPDALPPRVIGLIAEMPVRRRIFLPIGRVISIEPDAVVLGTGTLNLRRFSRRRGELLVLENLLDRRITITDTGTPAVVVDVAMECLRPSEWSLTRVAVRQHTGRLTRRGQLQQLEYGKVDGLTTAAEQRGAAGLLAQLDTLRAADLANALQDLPRARRVEIATTLDDERLADVLEELPERDQIEIIGELEPERAADVLEEMDPDDAADLLTELSQPEREVLLGLMAPEEASPVRQLLNYLPGTAGSIMTSEPIIMTPDATVADALARIRKPSFPDVAERVRHVSRHLTGRYLGVAHFLRRCATLSALLGAVVDGTTPLVSRALEITEDGDRDWSACRWSTTAAAWSAP